MTEIVAVGRTAVGRLDEAILREESAEVEVVGPGGEKLVGGVVKMYVDGAMVGTICSCV